MPSSGQSIKLVIFFSVLLSRVELSGCLSSVSFLLSLSLGMWWLGENECPFSSLPKSLSESGRNI